MTLKKSSCSYLCQSFGVTWNPIQLGSGSVISSLSLFLTLVNGVRDNDEVPKPPSWNSSPGT